LADAIAAQGIAITDADLKPQRPMAVRPVCANPVRADRIANHIQEKHPKPKVASTPPKPEPPKRPRVAVPPVYTPASNPVPQRSPKPPVPAEVTCPNCGRTVVRGLMAVHLRQYCPDRAQIDQRVVSDVPVVGLSFELLPPGTWDVGHIIEYYRRHETRAWPAGRTVDALRIVSLRSLNLIRCYVGTKMWHGYILFEFDWSGAVVLECPITGNATYVLSGNWTTMLGETKRALNTVYSEFTTKVVHKGDWLFRVRQALPRTPVATAVADAGR
jgi:hypothetical protein